MDKSRSDVQTALEAIQQAKALKSPRTLEWYRGTVGAFRAWLVANGHSTILADVTSETVRAYLAAEAAREYRIAHRTAPHSGKGPPGFDDLTPIVA